MNLESLLVWALLSLKEWSLWKPLSNFWKTYKNTFFKFLRNCTGVFKVTSLSGSEDAKLSEIHDSIWNTFLFLMNVSFIWYVLGSQHMLSFGTIGNENTLRDQINVQDAYDFSAEMSSWTLLLEPWTLMISTNFFLAKFHFWFCKKLLCFNCGCGSYCTKYKYWNVFTEKIDSIISAP